MIKLFYLARSGSLTLATPYLNDLIEEADTYLEEGEILDDDSIWDTYHSTGKVAHTFVGQDGYQYTLTNDKHRVDQIIGGS